ncbi:peroxidase [Solihabitans fulvus]|uniref:Peroxidase n=1 Tax=Solihabitans fulvus TaxID=1892852 RepID=A0A5B2X7K0_9PSEU|nr:heme peroxidase family protein [Solihabitans fulvus]KAA2259488.1 peroxidase [Solihabitans fulvus]
MSAIDETGQPHGGLSRRGFLSGFAAGAAGAIALPTAASSAAELQVGPDTSPGFFGRMFPTLPPFAADSPAVRDALLAMGAAGGPLDAKDPLELGPIGLITNPAASKNNRDNPFHTAGTTFFGQFVDHDLTFDVSSRLAVPQEPLQSPNGRVPTLDLDPVYGGGPVASPELYDPADRAKLLVETNGQFEDLPRRADSTAIIGDPRNDENLMVAGLHAAFLLFHNKVVDRLRAGGTPQDQLFAAARQLVTWHYQWIVLHTFVPQICGFGIQQEVLFHGRRFYRPGQGHYYIPVEFQGAAYRFGHSMVRPSYRANLKGDTGNPFFGFIFDPSGEGQPDPVDLRGGARAARRFIGWQTFFDFRDGQVKTNKRIDTRISTPLFQVPLAGIPGHQPPVALPQRNLLRHITWSLPSGQSVAAAMGIPVLGPDVFPELAQYGVGFERSTPLWYYVLREAEYLNDGISLAGAGARLVAEVIIGLLELDSASFLASSASWTPTLPRRNADDFDMVDLLTFAGVDPASRGQ